MWLFTTFGFFSVVRKPGDQMLTVRARARADLDQLREDFVPQLGPTIAGGGTDYPYRAVTSPDDLTRGVGKLVGAIDYANFKDEVARVAGAARAKVCGEVWSAARKITGAPTPRGKLKAGKDAVHGAEDGLDWHAATRFGGVVFDAAGRCLLVSPAGGYGGYAWTFPKGKPDPGEAPADTARREVREESGVVAEIVAPVPGVFAGTTSKSAYYVMRLLEDTRTVDFESAETRWVTSGDAESLIAQTPSAIGRKRDQAVLRATVELWRSLRERPE
jgi:8-oxo-dGTP pyrophosphatase MutT (NUDIX family)